MSKEGELETFDFEGIEREIEEGDSSNTKIEPVIRNFRIGLLYECFLDALKRAGDTVLENYLDSERPFSCTVRCRSESEKSMFYMGLDTILSGFHRQQYKGRRPEHAHSVDYNLYKDDSKKKDKDSLLPLMFEARRLYIFMNSDQQLSDSLNGFLDTEIELHCTPAALENAVRKYIASDYKLEESLAGKFMKIPLEQLMSIFSEDRPTFVSHNFALAWLKEHENNEKIAVEKSNETSEPTLDDLHGLGAAGAWGRDLAQDLLDWQQGNISWSDVDRGILLYGAPGTGKTTFAGALARTCGVTLIATSMSQWQAKGHLGDYLKAMRKAFDDARNNVSG